MKTDPILELMALALSGVTTFDEVLDALQEAYRMGREDAERRHRATRRTVEMITWEALHGKHVHPGG